MKKPKLKNDRWRQKFEKWIISSANGDGECKGFCPIHEDPELSRTPSASFNFGKGTFICFSQCGGMSLRSLSTLVSEDGESASPPPRRTKVRSINEAPSAKQNGRAQLPNDTDVQKWCDRLLEMSTLVRPLKVQRGWNIRTIEKLQIGWDGERYTIPIRDDNGELVNVRRYKLEAKRDKMMNFPGWGTGGQLYLLDALEHDEIVLCEGEPDAILGRQHGLNTMTFTTGVGSWRPHWAPLFKDKVVYLCFDCDDAGRMGAKKAAASLSQHAKEVRIISLPLAQKGGDLTNYLVDQGFTAAEFEELMKEAPLYERTNSNKQNRKSSDPAKVGLEGSMNPLHADKPIETTVTISGKVNPPYYFPKKVILDCEPGSWQIPKCNNCPMMTYHSGHLAHDVPADDQLLMRMIDRPEDQRRKDLLKSLEIPHTCPRVEIDEEEKWGVEELVVVPSVDNYKENSAAPVSRKVYNVGAYNTPINTTVRMTGASTTDPKSGRGLMQVWQCDQVKTSLDSFQMNEEMCQRLKVFQPRRGQTPMQKLREIAEDLEANVTRIYGRPELHIAYDVVWHSLMDFRFRDVQIGKGWLELLVVGDTRTGKSEAALKLCEHYQAGVLRSCEGATLAGLIGGAQQVGNSWVITWGTIPLQDRRLVVLDELSGITDKNIIEQMSAVRSSGKAQVTKIVSQETNARTRLIWIGNPPDGRTLSETPRGGIEVVQSLVKNPEDVARFDMAISAASSDVSSNVINSMSPPKVKHRYKKRLCSELVLWAWSRGPEDVVWGPGAEARVLEYAEELGVRYVPEPPLVQVENIRIKLARISVAIAARLFSHTDDGEGNTAAKVLVTQEHVIAAVEFLDEIYGMKSFGYQAHSRQQIRNREKAERSKRECRRYLRQHSSVLSSLIAVMNDSAFRVRDLEEFGGMMRDEAQQAIIELQRMHMVTRRTKGYIRMTEHLTAIVKRLEQEEELG